MKKIRSSFFVFAQETVIDAFERTAANVPASSPSGEQRVTLGL
jgi:hypothetical protein